MLTNWPRDTLRIVLDSTDSTNLEARRQASAGGGAAWILAYNQTAGRGRQQRKWESSKENFTATLLLPVSEPPEHAAKRSLVAAISVVEAIGSYLPSRAGLACKWPNDVLINGKKIAGILLDFFTVNARSFLAIGIGVNLTSAAALIVENPSHPPVGLADIVKTRTPAPEEFLDNLAPIYAAYDALFTTNGFDPIRERWLSFAFGLGKPVVARVGKQTLEGIFEDLDLSGAFILRNGQNRKKITAADIFFQD